MEEFLNQLRKAHNALGELDIACSAMNVIAWDESSMGVLTAHYTDRLLDELEPVSLRLEAIRESLANS